MNGPLVSVVLPTHNRPHWLDQALVSVLEGEFGDFEVVVSNNGNPEHTRRLADSISDKRVRWIEHDQSVEMLDHFLAAVSVTRGKYLAFLHDDDRWSPQFLAALVPQLESRDDAVLAFSDHYNVRPDGEIDLPGTEENSRRWGRTGLAEGFHQPFFQFAADQTVPITGAVLRRGALPLSDMATDVSLFNDIWITYLLASTGGAAYYRPERLLYKRVHDSSVNAARLLSEKLIMIRCREQMLDDPRMRPYEELLRQRLARSHLSASIALMRDGARKDARDHIGSAIQQHPSLLMRSALAATWVTPSPVLAQLARLVR